MIESDSSAEESELLVEKFELCCITEEGSLFFISSAAETEEKTPQSNLEEGFLHFLINVEFLLRLSQLLLKPRTDNVS